MNWTTHPGGWNHERETMHVLRDEQGRGVAHFHFNRLWSSCHLYDKPDIPGNRFDAMWVSAYRASWQAVRKEVEAEYKERRCHTSSPTSSAATAVPES